MRLNPVFIPLLFLYALYIYLEASSQKIHSAKAANQINAPLVTSSEGPLLSVEEVEGEWRALPDFKLQSSEKTPKEIVSHIVLNQLLPEKLYVLDAQRSGLADEPKVKFALTRIRAQAELRFMHRSYLLNLEQKEIEEYYLAHLSEFNTDERILVWRILFETEDEAKQALVLMKQDGTVETWQKLSREKNKDKGSALRGGHLGFLFSDGRSSEPGLKVDPKVVEAVKHRKDGEFALNPVKEGSYYGILWRRGSTPAKRSKMADLQDEIRARILRQRDEQEKRSTILRLRQDRVSEIHEELLGLIDIRSDLDLDNH